VGAGRRHQKSGVLSGTFFWGASWRGVFFLVLPGSWVLGVCRAGPRVGARGGGLGASNGA
jgi:hypothetical protein